MGIGLRVPNLGIPDDINQSIAAIAARTGLPESVLRGVLNGPDGVPTTQTRLSHGYTLRTAKNRVIGAVFRTSVDQGRNNEFVYGVEVDGHGEPSEIVPQEMTSQKFSIAIFDLNTRAMEEAFDTDEVVVLTDQARGLRIREVWRTPTSILGSANRRYEYLPCWFNHTGREVHAEGDRVIRVNADLDWLTKRRVQ